MPGRRGRRGLLIVALGLTIGLSGGATYGAFSATTANGANTLATDTDWQAPSGSSVIARAASVVGGSIAQGSSYYVYANATDAGNPASGVASVRADVSTISTGQTNVALSTSGGPWTIGGVSYAYRSAALTANTPLAAGSKSYTVTFTDAHTPANGATQTFSVTVDNSGPTATDIQANNGDGIPGAGDWLAYTFSEPMDPGSILAGWTGSSTTVQVLMRNGGCGANDSATVLDPGGGTGVKLGDVCLGDVVNGNRTFTTSTMAMAGSTITVTLGGNPGGTKAAANTTMTWTPNTAATDVAGNAVSATAATESGPLDTDL